MRPLRLAFARISQETNALSPLRTELEDFERVHYLEGDALGERCVPGNTEAEGFLKNAELSGFTQGCRTHRHPIETVPLMSAWAIPAARHLHPLLQHPRRAARGALVRRRSGGWCLSMPSRRDALRREHRPGRRTDRARPGARRAKGSRGR